MKRYFFTFFIGSCMAFSSYGQDLKLPAPSPTAVLKQDFSTSAIEITYSRPALRGRKIFGDLVPYGQVWRTGANTATRITFGEDISLQGIAMAPGNNNPEMRADARYQSSEFKIPKGTYALYTVPGVSAWKIIINKGIGNWGVSGFDAKDDVAEFMVPVGHTAEMTQSFSISVDNISGTKCDIVLSWESTKVTIPVIADNDKKITDYLEQSINQPKRPYQQAANYYLETGKDLNKALAYTDKAIEENKEAFWLYWLKARIYQKQGNKKEAIAAAQKSAALAAATPYADEYKRNAEGLEKQMK